MTSTLPSPHRMYQALLDRDATYDGVFIVGVRTTGVFCRPVCPARRPLRQNVEFFSEPSEAKQAGYRPCARCRPLDAPGTHPEWVQGLLARMEAAPDARLGDAQLQAMGVEPARARRYFRSTFGMTLHAYRRTRRLGFALDRIGDGAPLLQAGFGAGYESDSGFRDAFKRLFGVPPGAARGIEPVTAMLLPTPLGPMLAATSGRGVAFLEFVDRRGIAGQARALQRHLGAPVVPGRSAMLKRLAAELTEYFSGVRRRFEIPLDVGGSVFQEAVWQALRDIPYGETRCYEGLARAVGRPGASRAVGRANGQNRVAIIIPCHRVIRKDGTLCGYGGGLWRKKQLLALEAR